LAETVRHCAAVIFVDAAEGSAPGEVRSEELRDSAAKTRFSHQLSPQAVLALAKQLYDASPRAFYVTMTGQRFDHGDSLSPAVAAALPALAARIEATAKSFLSSRPL
jgi:hydrogenase maturation protease